MAHYRWLIFFLAGPSLQSGLVYKLGLAFSFLAVMRIA